MAKKSKSVQSQTDNSLGDPMELQPVKTNTSLYFLFLLVLVGISALAAFASYVTWDVMLWRYGSLGFNLSPIFALPALALWAISLRNVDKDESGAIYFGGTALMNVGPGFKIVPPGTHLVRRPADIQEIQEPGPRDMIFWGGEENALPPGKVYPIFVNSRSQVAGETRALDVQMQYAVAYYIFWCVSDDVATFLRNTRSLKEGTSQLKLLSLTLLDQIVGRLTVEGVIANQENVNDEFIRAIRVKARGMGIRVTNAGLHGFNLSHAMATAMRDRAMTQFKVETQRMETDANAYTTERLGEAHGKALQAEARGPLVGRAEGMAKIKDDLGVSGEAVLAQVVLLEGWPKSTVLAGATQGSTDLIGAAAGVAAVFKNMGDKS